MLPVKLIIVLFCVLVNFQEFLSQKMGLGFLGYLDEFVSLSAYILAPIILRRRVERWLLLILLLPIASILHAVIFNTVFFHDVRYFEILVQSLINFKFFLYFLVFYCLWLINGQRSTAFVLAFLVCLLLSLLGYLGNYISPMYFAFSSEVWHLERNRISGFQFKPNDLAILLSFALIYCLLRIDNALRKAIFVGSLMFLIFYTSSRTALIVAYFSMAFYWSWHAKKNTIPLMLLPCLAVVLFFYQDLVSSFFFTETVSNFSQFKFIDQSQYIRAIMMYHGFLLGVDFFPLGVGASNFGGVMSAGSLVYDYIGVSNSSFFESLSGVYDSNIASVLGEYGFTGFILYLYLTVKFLRLIYGSNDFIVYLMFFVVLIVSVVQPFYSYQVNSVNFILLAFSTIPSRAIYSLNSRDSI